MEMPEGFAEQGIQFLGIFIIRDYLQLSVVWQLLPSCVDK